MEVQKSKTLPAELRQVLEMAARGEAGALPAMSAAFDAHPELVAVFGDLAAHAESALLNLATKSSPVATEAVKRQLRDMRERLDATAGTELERLHVTRVSLDWLSLQHAQIDLADRLEQSGTRLSAQAAQRRLDRAHARFLASTRTLASVAKLVRRAPSPLDFLRVQGDAMVPSKASDRATQRFHAAAAVN